MIKGNYAVQPAITTSSIGKIIHDYYVIEGLLGKGGFGAVYLVRDIRSPEGRTFALKEVVVSSEKEMTEFLNECKLLHKLSYPALPKIYHAFHDTVTGQAYMLMDYIRGPNLELQRQQQPLKRFTTKQALRIMLPIVEAIKYLHTQKPSIIHRDIKPANIVLRASNGRAVLVDFGIAKEYSSTQTTSTDRKYSPGYAAPEQYATGTDTRTDIYELGATLYTLLTGNIPVDALTRITQFSLEQEDPLEPVISNNYAIPKKVSDAITKAMSLKKEERYRTVTEFWNALNPGRRTFFFIPAKNFSELSEELTTKTLEAETLLNSKSRWAVATCVVCILCLLAGFLAFSIGQNQNPISLLNDFFNQQSVAVPVTPTVITQISPINPQGYYTGILQISSTNVTSSIIIQFAKGSTDQKVTGTFQQAHQNIYLDNVIGTLLRNSDAIVFTLNNYPQQNKTITLQFQGQATNNATISGTFCTYRNNQCDFTNGISGTWQVTTSG